MFSTSQSASLAHRAWSATVCGTLGLAAVVGWPAQARHQDIPSAPEFLAEAPYDDDAAQLERLRSQALDLARPSLAWADHQAAEAVPETLIPVFRFFQDSKIHTGEFAKDVLGFQSKWFFVRDKLPLVRGGRHNRFLQDAFARHLFTEHDLTRLLEQVGPAYADRLAAIENEMLVRLRADLADLDQAGLPAFADPTGLQTAYKQAVDLALKHVRDGVRSDVAQLVVALAAEQVLEQVAIRLGVSAAVLGTGAGASWATLGASAIASLLIDQLVSAVWNWWANPQGELAASLSQQLDQLVMLLVEGDAQAPGLRTHLVEFAAARATLRKSAIEALIRGSNP